MVEHRQEIACSGAVFSQQTLRLPRPVRAGEPEALRAGALYWEFLRRFGYPILTIRQSESVELRLPGLLLLAFRPPLVVRTGDGFGLRYPVSTGATVDARHQNQGYLQMAVEPDTVSLTVQDYYPNLIRLHPRIYEWTQSALHLRVARGYLPRLADWLLREATAP